MIPRDESIVICVTGNGYKTAEVVADRITKPVRLSRALKDFEAWHESRVNVGSPERLALHRGARLAET